MPIKPSMFLTNHALVLIQIWREPDLTVRAIAESVGITERATFRILKDLMGRGCVARRREGRRNRYLVQHNVRLLHPLLADYEIGELLKALGGVQGRS
jgi:DNA-binding IclR family transcriptional regulator